MASYLDLIKDKIMFGRPTPNPVRVGGACVIKPIWLDGDNRRMKGCALYHDNRGTEDLLMESYLDGNLIVYAYKLSQVFSTNDNGRRMLDYLKTKFFLLEEIERSANSRGLSKKWIMKRKPVCAIQRSTKVGDTFGDFLTNKFASREGVAYASSV